MDRTCSGTSHSCSIRLGSGEFRDQIKTSGGAERIVLLMGHCHWSVPSPGGCVMPICSFGKLSNIVFKVSWVNPSPQQRVMTPCNHFPFFALLVRSGVSKSLLSCGEQVRTCSHDFWLKNVSHYAYLL